MGLKPLSKITPEGEVENRACFCAGCNPTGGHRAAAGFCGYRRGS